MNTSGDNNTANGSGALFSNVEGNNNTSGGAASMPRILYRARKGERAQLIVMAQSAAGLGDAAEKEACRTR